MGQTFVFMDLPPQGYGVDIHGNIGTVVSNAGIAYNRNISFCLVLIHILSFHDYIISAKYMLLPTPQS